MSSSVLNKVTSALVTVVLVEPLIKKNFCDVKFGYTFALRLTADAVYFDGAPDPALEIPEDAEVRSDPRAACSPGKLRIESSHRGVTDCILINIDGVRSGSVASGGHCVSDDGSGPVSRAHPPDHFTTL